MSRTAPSGLRTSLDEGPTFEHGATQKQSLLACIVSIANFKGGNVTLSQVQRHLAMAEPLPEAEKVAMICHLCGLAPRPMKMKAASLQYVAMPCVIRLPAGGYAVLRRVTKARAYVATPSDRSHRLDLDEFMNEDVFVVELDTLVGKTSAQSPKWTYRDLIGRVDGKARSLTQVLLLGISLEIFSIVLPLYSQIAVDSFIPFGDRDFLLVLSAGFLIVIVLRALTDLARGWALAVISASINVQWMGAVFRKLLELPLSFFAGKDVGNIASRFNGVFGVQSSLAVTVIESVLDGLLTLVTFSMMLFYSLSLSAIPIFAILAYISARTGFLYLLQRASAAEVLRTSEQSSLLIDVLARIQTVKTGNAGARFWRAWMEKLVAQKNASLKAQKYHLIFKMARDCVFGIERIAVIGVGCLLVANSRFSIGMLFAFLAYKEQFSHRAAILVDRFYDVRALRFQAGRIAEIVKTPAEARSYRKRLSSVRPEVRFENVSFRHRGMNAPLFDQISFSLQAGEIVALSGESGAGKTTVLKLLLRVFDGYSGRITVGGQDLGTFSTNELRDLFATVLQEDGLFEATVFDNICMHDPEPDIDRLFDAARLACIHDEIQGLPNGFHTSLGASGTPLSKGQRDRVLIARALYRQCPFLLLDEAAGGLDDETAMRVMNNIASLRVPTLIVTHSTCMANVATRTIRLNSRGALRRAAGPA